MNTSHPIEGPAKKIRQEADQSDSAGISLIHGGGGRQGAIILLFGPQPVSALAKAFRLAGKGAVIDNDVARMGGSTMAIVRAEALDAIKTRLSAVAIEEVARQHPELSRSAAFWLSHGERGISSNTIFSRLTGVDVLNGSSISHPYDPADVRRCQLLLEQVPELQARFHRMADASDTWARLVHAWPSIIEAMDDEVPEWRDKRATGSARRAYELIQKARGVES